MRELYIKWCKLTKRSGGILVHGSVQEFFDWVASEGYHLTKVDSALAVASSVIAVRQIEKHNNDLE
jgi:hypothetical protein